MSELQRTATATSDQDRRVERTILAVLLASSSGRPWSTDELVLELGAECPATLDGIDRLHRAGLIHRCEQFVFVTRAASVLDEVLR